MLVLILIPEKNANLGARIRVHQIRQENWDLDKDCVDASKSDEQLKC